MFTHYSVINVMTRLILILCFCIHLLAAEAQGDSFDSKSPHNLDDVLLLVSPENQSTVHYILNTTTSTSITLQFNPHLDHRLPPIPPKSDYGYFTCFQIERHLDDSTMSTVLPFKCYQSIPHSPFTVSHLTNGSYLVTTSLLRASRSDPDDVSLVKEERTMFVVQEMIDFHANYEWQYIEDHHSINHGLDVQMRVFGENEDDANSNDIPVQEEHKKMVRIPPQWVLQQFVSSDYRLLWLLVSKRTSVASIKEAISNHTGISIGCIDLYHDEEGREIEDGETVESLDWFYNKHSISVALNSSTFCEPVKCGFGYLKKQKDGKEVSTKCDYITAEYHKKYRANKGKMWVDVTNDHADL